MSSPLAVAAVSATLCDLLNNGLINHDLAAVGSFAVTSLPPDRIETGATEANRLNLFLYHVSPNPGWRNHHLPSRDASDQRLRTSNPPLALDLHYMLTAYGNADWAAEVLLGYAMEVLHDTPVLSRKDIRTALGGTSPINLALIPNDPQGRKAIDLADQIEQVKITPHYLTADELSRLWTAMQARYRPTMVYQVSTVLIQSTRAAHAAPPVLRRGEEDRGVDARSNMIAPDPSRPTITSIRVVSVEPNEQRLFAEQGDTLEIAGVHIAGDEVIAEFRHALLEKPLDVKAQATPTRVVVALPQGHTTGLPTSDDDAPKEWPAGMYALTLRIARTGKPKVRTNALSFTLVPRVTKLTLSGSGSNLKLKTEFFPQVWPGQRPELFVGAEAFEPPAVAAKTGSLTTSIAGVARSEVNVPVTLRIDGVDSQIVRDRTAEVPKFEPKQTVKLP